MCIAPLFRSMDPLSLRDGATQVSAIGVDQYQVGTSGKVGNIDTHGGRARPGKNRATAQVGNTHLRDRGRSTSGDVQYIIGRIGIQFHIHQGSFSPIPTKVQPLEGALE